MDRSHLGIRGFLSAAAVVVVAVASVVSVAPGVARADEVRDEQWHIKALEVDKAHKLSQGEGVTIGLIDGGVDADHVDLKGNIKPGKDFGTEGNGLQDEDGHGTWTSSLIVGHGHGEGNTEGIVGIAPKATIISVGIGGDAEAGSIADAIEWLIAEDVDIISVSMSGQADYDAVGNAMSQEIPVVASAGNKEPDPIIGKYLKKFMTWPANAPGAMPVSATTKDGKFWEHSVALKNAASQPQLGISAPGVDIMGAKKGGGYAAHDGTSASAPIVAGTLALIKSAYPDLTYAQWFNRLLDTTDDKGPEGYDDKFGWGIVNPYRALSETTTYEGLDGDEVSSSEDRIPLDEQGKGSGHSSGDGDAQSGNSTGELKPASSNTLVIALGIAGTAAVLAAAAVIVVAVSRRRRMKRSDS